MDATQAQDDDLAAAVALGWRVAELYSRVDDPGPCSRDTLLPAHGSQEPADQLELVSDASFRAAAVSARGRIAAARPNQVASEALETLMR